MGDTLLVKFHETTADMHEPVHQMLLRQIFMDAVDGALLEEFVEVTSTAVLINDAKPALGKNVIRNYLQILMLDIQHSFDLGLLVLNLFVGHSFGFYFLDSDTFTGISGHSDPGTVTVGTFTDKTSLVVLVVVV